MRKALQIIGFLLILSFLIYLVPPVRNWTNENLLGQVAEMVQLEKCGCTADSPDFFCVTEFLSKEQCAQKKALQESTSGLSSNELFTFESPSVECQTPGSLMNTIVNSIEECTLELGGTVVEENVSEGTNTSSIEVTGLGGLEAELGGGTTTSSTQESSTTTSTSTSTTTSETTTDSGTTDTISSEETVETSTVAVDTTESAVPTIPAIENTSSIATSSEESLDFDTLATILETSALKQFFDSLSTILEPATSSTGANFALNLSSEEGQALYTYVLVQELSGLDELLLEGSNPLSIKELFQQKFTETGVTFGFLQESMMDQVIIAYLEGAIDSGFGMVVSADTTVSADETSTTDTTTVSSGEIDTTDTNTSTVNETETPSVDIKDGALLGSAPDLEDILVTNDTTIIDEDKTLPADISGGSLVSTASELEDLLLGTDTTTTTSTTGGTIVEGGSDIEISSGSPLVTTTTTTTTGEATALAEPTIAIGANEEIEVTVPEEEITIVEEPGLGIGEGDGGDGCAAAAAATCDCDVVLECPETGLKDFDFGNAEGGNIPVGAEDAPHFVSHNRFYVVKLGPAVDAPEWKRDDKPDPPDQDGLDLDTSGVGHLDLDITHIVGNNLNYELPGTLHKGTIIVGRYQKLNETEYEFKVIGAESVREYNNHLRRPDKRFDPNQVLPENSPYDIGLIDRAFQEETEGWLVVIYTAADVYNNSFDINELFSWDGLHQTLMDIFNIPSTHPFDPTIPPGEIEDYKYCYRDKDGDGKADMGYYKPEDPAFKDHCPEEVEKVEEILVEPSIDDKLNITFICTQTQTQTCGNNNGGGAGTFTPGTKTSTNNGPLGDHLVSLLKQYKSDPANNTAKNRLELMHKFMISTLPAIGNNPTP
jgi:hypothetical protein